MADAVRGIGPGAFVGRRRFAQAFGATLALGAIASRAAEAGADRSDPGLDADDARVDAIIGASNPATRTRNRANGAPSPPSRGGPHHTRPQVRPLKPGMRP